MAVKTKAPKPLIKAATIATALDKQTGVILGFVVKSNHTEQYYHVHTEIIGGVRVFFCDCEAHLWGCDECCHIKAVKEVLVAKAELAQPAIAQAEAILAEERCSYAPARVGNFNVRGASCYINDAEMTAMKARVAARKSAATLNPNVGFQLMR